MFVLVGFVVMSVLNLTHRLMIVNYHNTKKIEAYHEHYYSMINCDRECLIKKALSQ